MVTTSLWDALILAGGTSSRMNQDKARLKFQGETLLSRSVNAVANAANILVSGTSQPLDHEVTWCLEDPPFSGPVSAIAEAVQHVTSEKLVIIPCDLAFPDKAVSRLLSLDREADARIARDPEGHIQWLTAIVSTPTLKHAIAQLKSTDIPVRKLFENMTLSFIDAPSSDCTIWEDMDTPEDVHRIGNEQT